MPLEIFWVFGTFRTNPFSIPSIFQIGNNTSLQYLPADTEPSSSAVINNSSGMIGVEPRKFSKYDPKMSTRSTHQVYRNYIDGRRSPDRKSGYIATGPVGSKSHPSKYVYTKNIEIQHVDVRPSIAHGKKSTI